MPQKTIDVDFPRVFTPLLKSARYKGAYGGRGSGKSWFFAMMVILRMVEQKTRIVCLREIQMSIRDSCKQLLEDTVKHLGWIDMFQSTEHEIIGPHGSNCIFRGLHGHTAASIKSLEGYQIAWAEEAQSLSQRSLDLLLPTIRADKSELWFSWNPISRLDPIDKLLRKYTPKGAIVVESNWQDNPWFPESLRFDMERDRQQDPEKAAHIWDGEYASVTGGAYYAALLSDARKAGRITVVDYDPLIPVYTAWDLGIGDSMSLWLWQQTPDSIRIIDHYENHSLPLTHYVKWLAMQPYHGNYADDWLPHDARVRELGTGLTRVETLKKLDRRPRVIPNHKVADGINAMRELLPRMWFDAKRCEYGLECLMQYREDYDERLLTLKSRPLHDWTSHTADAARYMAMAFKEMKPELPPEPAKWEMSTIPPTLDELWEYHQQSTVDAGF